jgi:hypothetical protein
MLAPVVVDLGPDVGAREVQIVIDACNDAISQGVCLPEGSTGDEAPRAVAVARAADDGVRVVRIEVRLASDDEGAPIVRELVFARRDPLRERWRSVGLAIATLVGEGERAREEARDDEAPVEPAAPAAPPPVEVPEAAAPPESTAPPAPPAPPPVVAREPEEPEEPVEPEEEEAPRAPFEHRSVFVGIGGFTGPGFGGGDWRVGGTLRGAWQAHGGLTLGTSLGYAWRASSRDFTAEWLSLEAGVGYRLDLSDATSVGVMLLGGAQRARFEVLAGGESRSEALWNPRAGVELDARWRATSGFGVWAAVEGGTGGRSSRLFVAPDRDPIEGAAVDAAFTLGLGWWLE